MKYFYAFLTSITCGLILGVFTAFKSPKGEGLRGSTVIFKNVGLIPKNRKQKRGFLPKKGHKPTKIS
jgi:hypothetical protein